MPAGPLFETVPAGFQVDWYPLREILTRLSQTPKGFPADKVYR